MAGLNETHDPKLKSWVASANHPGANFPIQNLPFGIYRRKGSAEAFRAGAAIGDQILDLNAAASAGVFSGDAARAAVKCKGATLNEFMALGHPSWSALRRGLSEALREGSTARARLAGCLLAQGEAEYALPARIGDYTDFFASIHHARTAGSLARPENPLLPNYQWVPIAYHGRASSIRVSGQSFKRPRGQIKTSREGAPTVAPAGKLDFELEIGAFIGPGSDLGEVVTMSAAEEQLFGLVLLNDWSARDVQAWEYQPLGPFLGKNFASTISPWIVTLEALEPFRQPWTRAAEDPQPLPYLDSADNRERGAIDMVLEVFIETEKMRRDGAAPARLTQSNLGYLYWTMAQMVAHHTINGCNLQPGDLLGTGTQSGPAPEQAGSMLELSGGGKQALSLPGGEKRTFLEDGDKVILRAHCAKPGYPRIGLGECVGTVLPPSDS